MQRSKKTISSLVFSHLVSEPCFLSFPAKPSGCNGVQLEEKARCQGRQEIEEKTREQGRGLRGGRSVPSAGAVSVVGCRGGLGQVHSQVSCHSLIDHYLMKLK